MARKAKKASNDTPAKVPGKRGRPPKVKAESGNGKAERKESAKNGPLSGIGHNLKSVRQAIGPFFERYSNLLNEKETNAAEYMSDIKALLEDAANELGCARKLVRQALQDKRRQVKQDAKEAELEPTERSQLETMRDALGLYEDTPLGQAAIRSEEKKQKQPAATVESFAPDDLNEDHAAEEVF